MGQTFSPYYPRLPSDPTDETLCAEAVCREVLLGSFRGWLESCISASGHSISGQHISEAISIMLAAVCAAQTYVRAHVYGGHHHDISLRDIHRCLAVCQWVASFCTRAYASGLPVDGLPNASVDPPDPNMLSFCLLTGLHCTYVLRLDDMHRHGCAEAVCRAWQDSCGANDILPGTVLAAPRTYEQCQAPFNCCCDFLVSTLGGSGGIALNQVICAAAVLQLQHQQPALDTPVAICLAHAIWRRDSLLHAS